MGLRTIQPRTIIRIYRLVFHRYRIGVPGIFRFVPSVGTAKVCRSATTSGVRDGSPRWTSQPKPYEYESALSKGCNR